MEIEKKVYTFDEIKQKIVNYCVYQDRCHSEVEKKMREFALIPEAKEEIILYLLKENYLNEERFTRSYIRGKFYIKNWGKNKIEVQLKIKGISKKLIASCFDEINEQDYLKTIKRLYENYSSKINSTNHHQVQFKTVKYLIGRGFEYESILEVIDN